MSTLKINRAAFTAKKDKAEVAAEERSQFWLNVGYSVDVDVETDAGIHSEERFVSLNSGIALDRVQELKTNSSNQEWSMFQSARNELLEQLLEVANALKPGQSQIIDLQVELRRVKDEAASVAVNPEENPFVKKLSL